MTERESHGSAASDHARTIEDWSGRVEDECGPPGEKLDGRKADLLRDAFHFAQSELAESEHARAEAELASKAKSRLLATISHELRTPLTAIGGYTELLALGLRGPVTDEQRQDLDRIHRAQQHMAALLDDLLLFFRLGAGGLDARATRVPVADIMAGLTTFIAPQANHRRVGVVVHTPLPTCAVLADLDRCRQVLINLLTNAIKFSPAGSQVDVRAIERSDAVDIEVHDHGEGIAAEMLDAVFQPFVQVDAETIGRTGFGLGLAISRQLAELMAGSLTVRSAPGTGSCFVLTLPTAPDRPAPDGPRRRSA